MLLKRALSTMESRVEHGGSWVAEKLVESLDKVSLTGDRQTNSDGTVLSTVG